MANRVIPSCRNCIVARNGCLKVFNRRACRAKSVRIANGAGVTVFVKSHNHNIIFPRGIKICECEIALLRCAHFGVFVVCNINNAVNNRIFRICPIKPKGFAAAASAGNGKAFRRNDFHGSFGIREIAEDFAAVIIFPAANAHIIIVCRAVSCDCIAFGKCVVYPFAVNIGFKFGVGAPLNIISVANRIIPACCDFIIARCNCNKIFNRRARRANSVGCA